MSSKKKSRLYLTAEMTGKPKLPPEGSIALLSSGWPMLPLWAR
jgi:hypothetical protein